jgi:hypothetical protein
VQCAFGNSQILRTNANFGLSTPEFEPTYRNFHLGQLLRFLGSYAPFLELQPALGDFLPEQWGRWGMISW